MILQIFVDASKHDGEISDLDINQLGMSDGFITHVWKLVCIILVPASTGNHSCRITYQLTYDPRQFKAHLVSEQWEVYCARRSDDISKMLIMTNFYLRWENTASTNSQTSSHDVIWNRCAGWPWAADNLNEKIRSVRAQYFGSSSYLIYVVSNRRGKPEIMLWMLHGMNERCGWNPQITRLQTYIVYNQIADRNFGIGGIEAKQCGKRKRKCLFYQKAGLWIVHLEFQWSPMNISLMRKSPSGDLGDLPSDDSTPAIWIMKLDASF